MAVTKTDRFGLTRWSADTDEVTRVQFDSSMAAINDKAALDAQGTLAARPASAVRGQYYLATDTSVLYRHDGTQWRVVGSRVTNALITPESPTQSALTVQGLVGQSATLQVWRDSAGTALGWMNQLGSLTAARFNATGYAGNTALSAVGVDPSQAVASFKAAPGQTADLQQWLNSAGATVARINPVGGLTLSSDLVAATVRGTTVKSDGAVQATTGVSGTTGRFSTDVAAPNLTGSATSPIGLHSYRQKTDLSTIADSVMTVLTNFAAESSWGAFNYSGGIWTIPLTGRYRISASCSFAAAAGGSRQIVLRRNGTGFDQARISVGDVGYYTTVPISTSVVLNAGDEISVAVFQNSGGPVTAGKIGEPPARVTLDFLGTAP